MRTIKYTGSNTEIYY